MLEKTLESPLDSKETKLVNPKGNVDCNVPGFFVHHYLPEIAQTHVHWFGNAIQPSHSLLPSSLAHNLSQHQVLSQWVGLSHHMAKVLEFQLQHQSFQWIFRVDFLTTSIREGKEVKTKIQVGNKQVKHSLFADDMVLYIENPKDAIRKLLQLINGFGKVVGYKISI